MSINDKILERIKNLLSLAESGNNDEESQTALALAQKLMLKYKISQHDLSEDGRNEIIIKSLSVYKRIYWWERELAKIISHNFRVMFYMQSNRFPHQRSVQRKIVLMGYPEDVELAYEVYHLAVASMRHHATLYLSEGSSEKDPVSKVRRAYYQGFLDGLENKFQAQREALIKEDNQYALMIQTPQAVKDKYDEEIVGTIAFKTEAYDRESVSYMEGYRRGKKVNITNKSIESGRQ